MCRICISSLAAPLANDFRCHYMRNFWGNYSCKDFMLIIQDSGRFPLEPFFEINPGILSSWIDTSWLLIVINRE